MPPARRGRPAEGSLCLRNYLLCIFALFAARQDCWTVLASGSPQPRLRLRVRPTRLNARNNLHLEDASQALRSIALPPSRGWRELVPRLVLNLKQPRLPSSLPELFRLSSWQEMQLQMALPRTDILERYRTCAVVGNAGTLRNDSSSGAAIDNHDAVFRFNDGPTGRRFSRWAGSSTTFRLINNLWTLNYAQGQRPAGARQERLVLFALNALRYVHRMRERYGRTLGQILYLAPELTIESKAAYEKAYTALKQQGFVKVKGKNTAPSGIEGIFLALSLCRHVNVYGFNVDSLRGYPYHYYDDFQGDPQAHSFDFQALFLRLLEHRGLITLCGPGRANRWCSFHVCAECRQAVRGMQPPTPRRSQIASRPRRAREVRQ